MLNVRDARDEVPAPIGVHRDINGRHATVTVVVATDDDARAWAAATCATPDGTGGWSVTVRLADTGAIRTALDTVTYRIRTEETPMNLTTARLGLPTDDHTPDSVVDAARAAADLVQYLARATTDPHTTSAALGDLVTTLNETARDLEQVLGQVSAAALTLRTGRGMCDDRGAAFDPADTAERTADALAEAQGQLAHALPALQDASTDASHLGWRVNPAEGDDEQGAQR